MCSPHGAHNLPGVPSVLAGGAGHSTRQSGVPTDEQECAAFLTFLGLAAGLLLPLWLLVKTEPPASLARWDERQRVAARRREGGRGNSGDAPDGNRSRGDEPSPPVYSRVAAAVEGSIRAVCGRSWLVSSGEERPEAFELDGWQRALLWWQVLGLGWLGSMAIAGA